MLLEFTLILVIGAVGGLVAKNFKQPAVIGYITAGFLATFIFPEGFKEKEPLDAIAQIGVALLLFTLGIELNLRRFSKVVKIAVLGALLQIVLSVMIYSSVLVRLGFSEPASLLVALGFSLSSTAVVIKILNDKKLLNTLPGEIMTAWLLIQDLSVIPILIIVPFLGEGIGVHLLSVVAMPLVTVVYLLAVAFWFGRWLTPYLLKKVAQLNSPELLLVSTLSLCLAVAGLTQFLGLSYALGAFIAGIMISESTEHYAVFSQIRPLRDLFSIVFFVTLPLLVAPSDIIPLLPQALLVSLIVIIVKFCIVLLITFYFGYHSKVSFLVGIGLIQVGEFAFVLVREGLRLGLVQEDMYAFVLTVTIVTILATPVLFGSGVRWYEQVRSLFKKRMPRLYTLFFNRGEHGLLREELPYKDHVVLVGYGRMGKYIGRALLSAGIPFIVIELNRAIVEKLQAEKIPAVFGDPTDPDILDFAQVDHAKVLVVTIPDVGSQLSVILHAHKLRSSITIVSRAQLDSDQKVLKGVGADVVIHPEFTASVAAAQKVLGVFNTGKKDIEKNVARLKIEHGME
jgi:monovalent cation:H+ antiporter-2, CPA2 family